MPQLAIPAIGAMVGGIIAPGVAFSTLGAQIGWMVGAALWSAVQPTPVARAGDPSTSPQVGSDIRGQTIPIIYGTVRTPGYLVWQNGFKPQKNTRRLGRGKKKQRQEFYTYYWDFVFHMGMATTNYKIVGMWDGSERVQNVSLDTITMADGSSFAGGTKTERWRVTQPQGTGARFFVPERRQLESTQAGKSVVWSEAYFYGAHPSTSNRQGWSHFQTTMNAPGVRWPHSLWFGVKELNLGEQPRIPQFNFEVQPDIPVVSQGGWSDTVRGDGLTGASGLSPTGLTIGGRFAVFDDFSGSTVLRVFNTETGQQVATKTAAQMVVDFPAIAPGVEGDFIGARLVPGTNTIAVMFSGAGGSNAQNYACLCVYTIDPNTGALGLGGTTRGNSNLAGWWTGLNTVGLSRDQSVLYAVGVRTASAETQVARFTFPATNGGGAYTIDWADGGADRKSLGVGNDIGTADETYGALAANGENFGFILPINSDKGCRFYGYVSRARIRWSDANPSLDNDYIATNKATYPNGWVFFVEVDDVFGLSAAIVANGDFNSNGPPFDDENENADGSSAGSWTSGFDHVGYTDRFFVGPCNYSEQNTNWVVCFHRQLSTSANTTKGARCTVRLFEYSPVTAGFSYLTAIDADMEDVSVKYDIAPAVRFSTLQDADALVAYDGGRGRVVRMGRRSSGSVQYPYMAYIGTVVCGVKDFTPPEIIRDIFINNVMGSAQPASAIDTDTYDAAVQFCRDNGIFVSAIFNSAQPRTQVFEALANIWGGWVAWTGTRLRFGKPEESLVPVRTITLPSFRQDRDGQQKSPVNGTRQAIQDTVNRVTVKFVDRLLGYRANEVTINDEVDQDLNSVRARIIETGMIMSKDTAYRLAERLLWGNLYGRSVFDKVPIGWKDGDLEPGDLITLIDEDSDTNLIVRIVKKEEVSRGKWDLMCVEELDYLGKSKPVIEEPFPGTRPEAANTDRPLDFEAYELPAEFSPEGPRYFVGWAPGGASAGAGLYTSASTIGFRLSQSVVPYPDAGYLKSNLPNDSNVAINVDVLVNVRSSANINAPAFWLAGGNLEDYSAVDRAAGLSLLRVGSEMLSYEDATLVGSNTWRLGRVYRGVGGTPIAAHSPGAVWWAHVPEDGGGLFTVPYAQGLIGTTVFYKVVPVGFDNVEFNIDSVPYKQFRLTGQHFAPAAMNDIRVLVGSPATTLPNTLPVAQDFWGTTSLFHVGPWTQRNVGSGPERNITVVWPETSKTSGYGVGGYDTYGYGFFVPDVSPSLQWRVTVIGSGGNQVAQSVVNSPFFSYDAMTNASQNGAWRGNVAFQVLPFNSFASAPFAAVRSVNLTG